MSVKAVIPGVNNAVQKLEELADRMRSDDFGFRDNDVDNIDKVIDALYELETERRQIHDELEKQTINSSILRHRLKVLPGQIRDEIMEAVMSARLSNANVLLELQEKLKGMTATITALEKRARELEQENAVLHPERELLKQQHEEIISQLNQRMAEKASMQIALNETRDKVRQANQDIVDLEDGILQLKEDLIQERTEARQEKKRLKRAVTDTTQKTKEQKDQNVTKKIELDHAQEKLMDSEGKLDTVRKSIRRFETSRAKLEGEERALAAQLSKQLKMNDQMRIKGTEIMNKRIEEERRSRETLQELEDRIKKFQFDIDSESFRQQELGQKKVQLLSDLAAKEEVMAEDAVRVEELDTTLQASKEALNTKAEEVGSMKRENIDMSEEIEILAESHKAVLAQLNKQIEEYREQLSRERKERMEIQALKDSVSKSLDDLKTENQFFMTEMTNVVQGGKKQHQELSNEGMQLQKTLKETEEEIEMLSENLELAQQKYQTMFDDYQKRTDTIEEEMALMEENLRKILEEQEHLKSALLRSQMAVQKLSSEMELDSSSSTEELSLTSVVSLEDIDTLLRMTSEERELASEQALRRRSGTSLDDSDVERMTSEERLELWKSFIAAELGVLQEDSLSSQREVGISMDDTITMLNMTTEEKVILREALSKGWTPHQAISFVSLSCNEKKEVLSLEASLEEKKHKLEEQMPVFEELEVYFKQRNEEYDNMKKTIGELRKRKQSLEDQIKRIIKDKELIKQPLGDLRSNLKAKRQKLMLQMQTNGKSTQEMEQQILAAGCKLRTVVEENFKFNEKCKKMEEDLANLQKDMEENEHIKARLQDELSNQKQDLMKKWEADNMMQEFFASRDEATAEAFGRLLSRTEKRENKIDMITARLKEELHVLGGFLDNISNRRPQECKEQQGEGSITPGKVVEAVAGANQESEESQERPDTGTTHRTATAVASSPSLHSARQLLLSARSLHSSRAGTPHSPRWTPHSPRSVTSSPRSALKSPKKAEGRRSPAKQAWFAGSTKGRCDP